MNKDIEKIIISEEDIKTRVEQLGRRITEDFKGKNLLLLCILKGSVVFFGDLMRKIDLPCEIDFIKASSYGDYTQSSGIVKLQYDVSTDISKYDILVIEDIYESGNTLKSLMTYLEAHNPKSLSLCLLFIKDCKHDAAFKPDYFGFNVPNEFVVGYGLDYAQKYRNLPYVGVLKEEIYNK